MQSTIEHGLCQCGCGGKPKLAKQNDNEKGYIKGQPYKFLPGHWIRGRSGEKAIHWKGGRSTVNEKYVTVLSKNHPKAHGNVKYVLEHILICEKALGLSLPQKTEIHHFNGNGLDNNSGNLILCEDRAYHLLLHKRTRALRECGHPDWLKCSYCKQYDRPENLYIYQHTSMHKRCHSERMAIYHSKTKKGDKRERNSREV